VTSDSTSWLTVPVPDGEIATGDTANVSLGVSCVDFDGVRRGTISVTSDGGNATVPLTLTCRALPALFGPNPRSLALTASRGTLSDIAEISIGNIGDAPLIVRSVSITPVDSWLDVSGPTNLSIAPNESETMSVRGQCADDVSGELSGSIAVSSNGGDFTVPVTLNCLAPQLANVSPESFELRVDEGIDTGTLTFANTGEGDLTYTVRSSVDSVCIDIIDDSESNCPNSDGGVLAPQESTIVPIRGRCPRVFGTTTSTLRIRSNGGDADILVTVVCNGTIAEFTVGDSLVRSATPANTQADLSMRSTNAKTFSFNWSEQDGADHYQLLESADSVSNYVAVSPELHPGELSYDHTVGVHLKNKASYKLQTCYESNKCFDSPVVAVQGNLIDTIGHLKGPEDSRFGADIDTSGDGKTMAVLHGTSGDVGIYKLTAAPEGGVDWVLEEQIDVGVTPGSALGANVISLNVDGDRLAMGLRYASGANCDCASGAVLIFNRQDQVLEGNHWILEDTLYNPSPMQGDAFGTAVKMDSTGTRVLIGSPVRTPTAPTAIVLRCW